MKLSFSYNVCRLLQDNNISGPIPPELGRLAKLEEVDLSDNLLSGEIPSSLSLLRSLQYLYAPLHAHYSALLNKEIFYLQ